MEYHSIAEILQKFDERTAQIAELIKLMGDGVNNQTMALHNLARISDVFAQSLTAISQRQIFAMEQQAHALEISAQALRIASEILKRLEQAN